MYSLKWIRVFSVSVQFQFDSVSVQFLKIKVIIYSWLERAAIYLFHYHYRAISLCNTRNLSYPKKLLLIHSLQLCGTKTLVIIIILSCTIIMITAPWSVIPNKMHCTDALNLCDGFLQLGTMIMTHSGNCKSALRTLRLQEELSCGMIIVTS